MSIFFLDLLDELRTGYLDDHGGDIALTSGYVYKWQDKDSPPLLWTNQQLVRHLNWAIMEIGKRNPIYDYGSVSTVTKINIIANKVEYPIDASIMSIEEVKLSSTGRYLTLLPEDHKKNEVLPTADYFNEVDWVAETGDVTHYVLDMKNRCIRLWKVPTAADSLLLTVQRRFDDVIDWDTISQESVASAKAKELPDTLRESIIVGAASRAFLKRDELTYNPEAAAFFAAEFDKWVGAPVDFRTLESRRRNANRDYQVKPPRYTANVRRPRSYYGNTTDDNF